MSLTHTTLVRNAIADAVSAKINAGSTDPTGDIQIATSTAFSTILALLTFSATSFGAASGGVATANAITSDTNAAGGGTAAAFRLRDRDNTEILRGSVTASGGGGDLQLSSTTITAGDTVSISSMTYTAPT